MRNPLITNKSYVLSEGKILAYGSSSELKTNSQVLSGKNFNFEIIWKIIKN